MANCNNLFQKFNGNGYLKIPNEKNEKLETSHQNVRSVIKSFFKKNHPNYSPKFYTQGSYKMGTTIRTKDDTCDLDDGVYFKNNPENVTGTTLQKWVKEAMDSITDTKPSHRKKCITLDFKAGYNIDLPIFLFNKDVDVHPKLAVKDSDFYLDDPKEFYKYFNANASAQLIRIVRFLKAWCDFKRHTMPSGLIMTIFAINHFQKNDRDDIALKFTLIEINNFLKNSFECRMPTTPNNDLLKNYDPYRKEFFLNNLSDFIRDAKSAIDVEKNQLAASLLWKKHLGDRFPSGEDIDEPEINTRKLATVIGNQKPYYEYR